MNVCKVWLMVNYKEEVKRSKPDPDSPPGLGDDNSKRNGCKNGERNRKRENGSPECTEQ